MNPFSLEDALQRIKEISSLLQEGRLNFDESLVLYEEAEMLIRQCQHYLNEAEIRLQQLAAEDDTD